MKREGRQHGMVRTFIVLPPPWNSRPGARVVNPVESPPTAGAFAKAPLKPTNHSKFTGKCGRSCCSDCHVHPASKSKDKAKGARKLRSSNVAVNHRLVAWRAVDDRRGLGFSGGSSASGMLALLSGSCGDEIEDDEEEVGYAGGHSAETEEIASLPIESRGVYDQNEMEFYDVGAALGMVEDGEEWCLVGECAL